MTTSIGRSVPLALLGLVALLTALLVLGASRGQSADAHATTSRAHAPVSTKELALRNDMRKLWEDHVTWTRQVIVSFAADLPDLDPAVRRLLRNQADIGNAITPYYGEAAGARLTALLREHILVAAELLAAAKADDAAALADARARWDLNGDDIAAFLAGANPANWPLGEMQAMMREHLDLTAAEALARLTGEWDADIAAYEKVHRRALQMADMLSVGIVRQFPQSFRP